MKILLASPPTSSLEHVGETFNPVGLNCIESYLKTQGYDPMHEDYHKAEWDFVEDELRRIQPDVLGMTIYTHTRGAAQEMAERTRKISPKTKIVVGGHHAAFMTQQVLEHFEVDAVVTSEGEVPFLHIVQALEKGEPLDGLPGLSLLRDGEVVKTPNPPPVPIDELPIEAHMYQDRTLTRKEAEFMSGGTLGPEPWQYSTWWMTTTRGCPYHCTFCSVLGRSSWRMESPKRVVDRMQLLHDKHNCRFLTFGDSSFNIKPARIIEICKEIVDRGLKMRWFASGMRANAQMLPEEMLEWMAKAGCALICYGTESGSPDMLKAIKKHLKPTDVDRAVTLTHKYGMNARLSLMIGNPGESEDTINQTLTLVDRIKPELSGIAVAQIYPGTDLFKQAKASGYMTDDYWLDGHKPIPFFPAADYPTIMRWYNKIRYRNSKLRGPISRGYGMRAAIHSKFGVTMNRYGMKFKQDLPPLFCDLPQGVAPTAPAKPDLAVS